jgi:cytochrome P450
VTNTQQRLTMDDIDLTKFDSVQVASPEIRAEIDTIVVDWATRPPFYVAVDGLPMVVVGRYADAREVLLDSKRFRCELPMEEGYEKFDKFLGVQTLAQMDGEPHHRIRRLIGPAFSPKALVNLEADIEQVVDGLLDAIESRGNTCDGVRDFGSLLLDGVLLTSMLRLDEEQKKVFHEMHRVIPLATYVKPGEAVPAECVDAFLAARTTIDELMTERAANPGDDLVSALVMAREEGDRLSSDELFDVVFTICIAALSGTARSMGRTMYALFLRPEVIARLSHEPALVPQAIAEAQRMYRQGYFMFPRIAFEDTEIGGTKIPQGMIVRVSLHAASYDPTEFPDPTRFDLDRNPPDWMAFGLGEHNCVGIRLARMAMRISITKFIQRFPNAHLTDPDFVPVYSGAVGELRMDDLPLTLS